MGDDRVEKHRLEAVNAADDLSKAEFASLLGADVSSSVVLQLHQNGEYDAWISAFPIMRIWMVVPSNATLIVPGVSSSFVGRYGFSIQGDSYT